MSDLKGNDQENNNDQKEVIEANIEIIAGGSEQNSKKTSSSTPTDELNNDYNELCEELSRIKSLLTNVMSKVKQYKKKVDKQLKSQPKKKKSTTKQKRQPAGITKPETISNELCELLKKPKETKMARTEITKEIYTYIKNNKLQNQTNKSKIDPDPALKKFLKLEDGQELTYFGIQKLLSPVIFQSKSSEENSKN